MLADLVDRLIEDNTLKLACDGTLLGLYSHLLLNLVGVGHLFQRLNSEQVKLVLASKQCLKDEIFPWIKF